MRTEFWQPSCRTLPPSPASGFLMAEKLAMGVVTSWGRPKNDVNSIVSGRPVLGAYEEPCGHHSVRGVGCVY